MKKPTAFAAGLKAIAAATANTEATSTGTSVRRRSRISAKGTVMIGAHFQPEVRRALLLIQAEHGNEGKNLKSLLGEAINLLADRYGKPRPFAEET